MSGASSTQLRATAFGAWLEGLRRAWHAPGLLLGVTIAMVAFTVPLVVVAGMTPADLRLDPVHHWFRHALLDGATPGPWSILLTVLVVVWTFLAGGVLDRLARARVVRTGPFWAACGVHGFRFLRLWLLLAPFYWAIFCWLRPWMVDVLAVQLGGDPTSPRTLWFRYTMAIVCLALIGLVNLIGRYARVRAVVEDRHSMISALGAALRFLRRRIGRVALLSLLNTFTLAVMVRVWYSLDSGAGSSPTMAWLITIVTTLLFVYAAMARRAAEVVFFQGELAHATYTAAPLPLWPESPSAEALRNLTIRHQAGTGKIDA
ncbi:MAG: hypothetical protein IT185_01435 [Acidobacteria bacterium]|nr:hypothetical protein [Acidobacteriota bacterium]